MSPQGRTECGRLRPKDHLVRIALPALRERRLALAGRSPSATGASCLFTAPMAESATSAPTGTIRFLQGANRGLLRIRCSSRSNQSALIEELVSAQGRRVERPNSFICYDETATISVAAISPRLGPRRFVMGQLAEFSSVQTPQNANYGRHNDLLVDVEIPMVV